MTGLSSGEVAERVRLGQANDTREVTSRSYSEIVRANIFTRFNAILGTLCVVILIFGEPWDALFGLVMVANTLIGIIQELRAKITLDRLSLLSAPLAKVIRDGEMQEIAIRDVVQDDVLDLRAGDQIVVDGVVLSTAGMEVDESLLTGESLPVARLPGEKVFSGTFVVAGSALCRATAVGEEAYARKLAVEARKFTLVKSDLRDGINLILKYITWIMIPAGALLLYSQLKLPGSFGEAVSGTVAGLVGMIPEGLVLLTSIAFTVSVITLGRRKVLVQELPAVEGLARVDVVCLDKTGTLTEGTLVFNRLELLEEGEAAGVRAARALGALAAPASARNATLSAIADAFEPPADWQLTGSVPFSSARKWSSGSYGDHGTWVLGAPEVLLEHIKDSPGLRKSANQLAGTGMRVLLLARSSRPVDENLYGWLVPCALVLLEEKVRPDAAETLQYFTEQDVSIKVISGDNPLTVAAAARSAGVPRVGTPVDARSLPCDKDALATAMEENTVFGRVSPEQKRSMVEALQLRGHVVAMTGDGVNDALALKKADIGIAMGSGSAASKAVSELVLLDGRFATLPGVVAEGRRVIGNIERVANLFLTKNVYSTLLSILIALMGWRFLFLPRHLTFISAATIGIPAFFLSFAPNKERYRPGFIGRVLRFSVPSGIIAALAALTAARVAYAWPEVSFYESRTIAALVLSIVALWVLVVLARPFTRWRLLLVLGMVAGLVLVFSFAPFREIFALDLPHLLFDMPNILILLQSLGIAAAAIILLEVVWRLSGWRRKPGSRKKGPEEQEAPVRLQEAPSTECPGNRTTHSP